MERFSFSRAPIVNNNTSAGGDLISNRGVMKNLISSVDRLCVQQRLTNQEGCRV